MNVQSFKFFASASSRQNAVVKLKTTGLLLVCLIMMLLAPITDAAMVDRVLVIVNDDVITQSEFDFRRVTLVSELQRNNSEALPADLDEQLLEGMIADRLKIQEALRRGIRISDQELQAAIQRFATAQQLDLRQLQQRINMQGQSFKRFTESVRDSMVISRLTEYYARTRVVVPDYEIDGFIEQNDMSDAGAEYRVARILISNSAENRELAKNVVEQLRDGASFQAAVLEYSEATDAQEGGEIGWRRLDKLPEIYASTVKALEVGAVSDVLSTSNGLHILKLLDFKGQREEILQSRVRHILIKAETDVAKAQASKGLMEVRERILAGEDFSALARIYSDDSVSAANGGDLGWISPGETVPNFEKTFEQLPLNTVSEPVVTTYGAHIMEVQERRVKNVTEQVIRNRVDNILRRQRAEREFDQWVRELKEEAYIEHVAKPAQQI